MNDDGANEIIPRRKFVGPFLYTLPVCVHWIKHIALGLGWYVSVLQMSSLSFGLIVIFIILHLRERRIFLPKDMASEWKSRLQDAKFIQMLQMSLYDYICVHLSLALIIFHMRFAFLLATDTATDFCWWRVSTAWCDYPIMCILNEMEIRNVFEWPTSSMLRECNAKESAEIDHIGVVWVILSSLPITAAYRWR